MLRRFLGFYNVIFLLVTLNSFAIPVQTSSNSSNVNDSSYWSLVTNQGCTPFTPAIDSVTADATFSHSWLIYDDLGNLVYSASGYNPLFPALFNYSQTYWIKHITISPNGFSDSLTLPVTVLPTPLAAFNVDTAACAPWTPNITDNSVGNNLSYDWNITANGTFASLATLNGNTTSSPTLSFADLQWPNNNQQYLLSLTVTSDSGCTNADTVDLTLYSRPKAGFQLPTDSCGPFTLTPNDTSKAHNNITQWLWRLSGPNGTTTSTSDAPTFNLPQSFNGNHNYTLILTVTDNNGCQDSTTENFQVFPTPTAAFTLQDTTCTGTNINIILTNNSSANDNSNNQLSYNWTIDSLGTNVHTTTDSIPNYTLTNNDTTVIYYTVTLTVTNNNGCDSTVFDTIYLAPNAIAQLDTLATLTDCAPFTIDTSVIKANHFSGNNNYTWNIFTTDGIPVTSFNGRHNLNYTITDDDTSFVVQLIVTSQYGCENDTVNVTVSTIENPNPYWSLVTNQGCAPFTPVLDSLAADATLTHSWIIYSSTGTILYNLSGTNPIWPALNNNSYTANQEYKIKHIVQAGTGCKDSLELTVTVLPTPLAAFNVDTAACAPWTPNITDNSVGNNLSYDWNITANGTFASLATLNGNTTSSPTLSFADLQWPNNNQQYLLSLTVTSDSGCTNADTVDLTLYSRPKAGFQLPTDSCGRFTLTPNDTSKTFNNITQWLWRLSGPNGTTTSTSDAPTFNLPQSFNGNHNYTLILTVTDNNGCQDSTTENFQVFPTPTAAFTLQDTTCTGTNINIILTNNSSANDNSNNQLSYNWTIDSLGTNVHTTTDSIPNYTLTNNDTTVIYYTVTLTVTNNNGCDSTVFDTIYLAPNAIAQLDTLATLTDCAPFTIDTSVIKANHFSGNNNYTWNIFTTDGIPVTSFNGRHNLNYTITDDDTSFVVQLIVTSQYGCENDTVNVTVSTIENPNPYWSLVTNQGCAPFTPVLDSLAADATLTHSWIIYSSTGTILYNLSGTNPIWPALNNNSYTANQEYKIKHIVQAGTGCKDSLELTVTVLPTPLAAFNVDTAACAPWTPNITDNSVGNNLSYDWNITANGTFASLATLNGNTTSSPTLSFADLQWPNNNQQYLLSLTVTSDSGCTNADTVDLTLYSRPKAGFQLPTDSCGPFTLTPNDTSKTFNNITQWLWRLSGPNGTTTSTSNAPVFNLAPTYNGNHNYSLTLIVTDNNGCQDSTTENFQAFFPPMADVYLQSYTCDSTNINEILYNYAYPFDTCYNLTYDWTIDSAGTNVYTSTDSIPNYILTNNDTTIISYTVTLTVTDCNGCRTTTTDTVQVLPFPNAYFTIQSPPLTASSNVGATCAPWTPAISYNTAGVAFYVWTIDSAGTNIDTSINSIPNYTFNNSSGTPVTYTLSLYATNQYGCSSWETQDIVVNSPSYFTQNVSSCGSYTWIDGNTYSSSTSTPTYTLTGSNGCDSVVTLNLLVNSPSYFTQNVSSCGSYTWIDGNTYSSSTSTPTYTLTGSNGCDSVVTLNLLVNSPSYFTQNVSSCGSYTWIDGNTYSSSTSTPTYTLTGSNGCDSVVTLNLLVNSPSYFTQNVSSCGSYTWIDGNTYSSSTSTPTYTLTGSNGCDSVVTLNLLVNSPSYFTQNVSSCGSYTWIDGNTYSSSTSTPTYTLTGSNGCDSVVTLNLLVNSPSYFTQNVSSCGSYTWIDGNTYSSSTSTPTYTLTGSNGCDSVVTLNLLVVNIIPTIQRNVDTIFTTAGYDLYSWYKCGSPNYQLLGTTTDYWFVVSSNGDYAVTITEGNCQDTTLCLTIEDLGEKELLQPKIQIYPNPADGFVLIDKSDYTGEVYMTIASADGRVLLRETPVSNNSILKLDVRSYASGSYIITLVGKDFSNHYTVQISH